MYNVYVFFELNEMETEYFLLKSYRNTNNNKFVSTSLCITKFNVSDSV